MGDFLKKVLPWIGAAATGGVPALIGMAAKEVGSAIGGDVKATANDIAAAVAGATPDQLLALKKADNEFAERMQAMGFNHVEEMARIGLQESQAFISDTQDARAKHAQNANVFRLGIAIILSFAVTVGVSMWGSYLILSGGISVKDIGIVAAVFGFLGTVVGYMASNAQQVVGFFFGSSKGSSDKTDAMADAVKGLGLGVK